MNGCREHGHGVVLICTILGAGVLSIECFGLWLSCLVFSMNAKGENVAEDLQKFESQTIVKERKK